MCAHAGPDAPARDLARCMHRLLPPARAATAGSARLPKHPARRPLARRLPRHAPFSNPAASTPGGLPECCAALPAVCMVHASVQRQASTTHLFSAGAPDLLGRRRLLDAANATVESAASTSHLVPAAPPPYVIGNPTSTPITGATYLLTPVGRPGCPMPTSGERLDAVCWPAAGGGQRAARRAEGLLPLPLTSLHAPSPPPAAYLEAPVSRAWWHPNHPLVLGDGRQWAYEGWALQATAQPSLGRRHALQPGGALWGGTGSAVQSLL